MKHKTSQIIRSLAPLRGIDGAATCIVAPEVPTLRQWGLRAVGVAAALLLWLSTANTQITLNGHLLTDDEKPVPDTRVGIAAGPSNTTDSKGQFSIKLSLDFIEGERVILVVHKPNWVINYPLDGEWNLPAKELQEVPTQYTKVIIVPKGSKALWTHARIEKHIALLSDEIAKLKKEGDTPRPIDFSYYLSEWANKYGFTSEQVKEAFDQWANAVKDSTDKRKQGLREFYLKNFAKAATLFEEAALEDEADLQEIAEALRQKTLRAYANWKDAGNSLLNLLQFEDALTKYQKASTFVPKERFPEQWAEIRTYIGYTKWEIGIRTEIDKANLLLKEAEQAFRETFEVYTREHLPQDWAGTQNNLGLALFEQGTRTGGEEGAKLLSQAVAAYRAALLVYTREQLPQQWATTKNNLGLALQNQGIRTGGEDWAQLLSQAVEAYRQALLVYTREQLPQQWATTQSNLGIALQEQGTRTGGEEGAQLLSQAVEAYRQALLVYTREQLPQDWAMTQNNLGSALSEQGTRTGGEEGAKLLSQAVEAYRQALLVYTREQLPQQWAATQNNLGHALSEQGIRMGGEEGTKLLSQVVEAYRQVLLVRTREQLPEQWATMQTNLGNALSEQSIRTGGEEGLKLLSQAVEAYRQALLVRTREQLPQDWAGTQNNLGTALQELGTRTGGEEGEQLLSQAVEAYRQALLVYTREQLPQDWAMTQYNLGSALSEQGTRMGGEEGEKLLSQAVEVYRQALLVYTREKLPQYWAGTQNNLGNALFEQGTRTGGEEGEKLLSQAVEAYRQALLVYTLEQRPQDWAMTQNNLGIVLQEQGTRTEDEEGTKLLSQAVEAYHQALLVYTYEHIPTYWAMAQNNLAEIYTHLQGWSNVATCYANVLKVYPDYEKAYQTASYLYHEVLFQFADAFNLNQNWLAQFPDDLSAQCNFAEKHFTTSRFAACEQHLAGLLENTKIGQSTKIALRAIGIANALAQHKTQQIPTELEALQTAIAAQPDTFKVGRTFNGVKYFISTNETLAPHRAWLLQFFATIERKEGREAILAGLQEARKNFSTAK